MSLPSVNNDPDSVPPRRQRRRQPQQLQGVNLVGILGRQLRSLLQQAVLPPLPIHPLPSPPQPVLQQPNLPPPVQPQHHPIIVHITPPPVRRCLFPPTPPSPPQQPSPPGAVLCPLPAFVPVPQPALFPQLPPAAPAPQPGPAGAGPQPPRRSNRRRFHPFRFWVGERLRLERDENTGIQELIHYKNYSEKA